MNYQEAKISLDNALEVIKERNNEILEGIRVAVGTQETSWTMGRMRERLSKVKTLS